MRSIANFNGTVIAPTSDYPYGNIKDDVLGNDGTKVNSVSNADIQQFMQRMAALAGVTPNGLPDNATNGFQAAQAVNTLWSRVLSTLSNTVGAINTTTPVVITGLVVTPSGGGGTISAGAVLYNGQMLYYPGGTYVSIPVGTTLYFAISNNDGLPLLSHTFLSGTPANDATKFSAVSEVPYQTGWHNLSGQAGGNWAAGATQPRWKIDAVNQVRLEGQYVTTSGSLSTVIDTLPVGSRPSQQLNFAIAAHNASNYYLAIIQVGTDGTVNLPSTFLPSASGCWVDISGISFSTT